MRQQYPSLSGTWSSYITNYQRFCGQQPFRKKKARHQAFLAKLKFAEDSGIQALMRRASHDDILVLLRASERDVALKKKLYSNMSENSIKIYVEDLVFQFRQGLPDYRLDEAMTRLLKIAESLAKDGTLNFEKT